MTLEISEETKLAVSALRVSEEAVESATGGIEAALRLEK